VTLSELSNRNEGLLNVALLLFLGPPEVFLGLLQVGLSVRGSIVDSRIRREADLLDRVGRGSGSSTLLLGWVLVAGVAVLVIDAAAAVAAASGRVLARDRCLRMFPLATVVALVVRQRTRRRRRLVVHGG